MKFPFLPSSQSPPEVADESLGIRVSLEEGKLVVRTADGLRRFLGNDPAALLEDLRAAVAAVPLGDDEFTPEELTALRVAVALHWAGYYLSTKQPIRVTPDDIGHPQTWNIVLNAAERKFGTDAPRAWALAARVLGIAETELRQWRRVEDDRQSLM